MSSRNVFKSSRRKRLVEGVYLTVRLLQSVNVDRSADEKAEFKLSELYFNSFAFRALLLII